MNIKNLIVGTFSFTRLIISAVLIYISVAVFVYYYAEQLIFPYEGSSYRGDLSGLDFIKTSDGINIATRLWTVENHKALILYFHGNYLDLGDLDEIAEQFNASGYSFLSMDYRGYGLSEGAATEADVNGDAQLLYHKAITLGYEPQDIVIVGRSVGTGVATELATENSAKALVLVSPFVSTFRVMTGIRLFPFDRFDNLSIINTIKVPLMIAHGSHDQLIKPWHSKKLYNAFKGIKHFMTINGAGHNDVWDNNYRLMPELVSFIQKQ